MTQAAPDHIRAALPLRGLDRLSGVGGNYVYRLYDFTDTVVYVGISHSLKSRLKAHVSRFREMEWDLDGFEADLMPDRETAEAFEISLTEKLRPKRNVVVGSTCRWVWL